MILNFLRVYQKRNAHSCHKDYEQTTEGPERVLLIKKGPEIYLWLKRSDGRAGARKVFLVQLFLNPLHYKPITVDSTWRVRFISLNKNTFETMDWFKYKSKNAALHYKCAVLWSCTIVPMKMTNKPVTHLVKATLQWRKRILLRLASSETKQTQLNISSEHTKCVWDPCGYWIHGPDGR